MSTGSPGHRLVTRRLLSSMMSLPDEYLLVAPDATAGDLLNVMIEGTSDARSRWALLIPDDGTVTDEHEASGLTADSIRLHVADIPAPLSRHHQPPDQVTVSDILATGGAVLVTGLSGAPAAVFRCLADIPDSVAQADQVTAALRGARLERIWQSCGIAVEWLTSQAGHAAQQASTTPSQ